MSIAWTPTQFVNLDLFRQYLARMKPPTWVRGATIHHTLIPTIPQWRGLDSMEGIGNHYEHVNKWEAGPHVFLCVGAPNPRHDGIFIGTPLDTKGIHAGACNSDRWGVEVVGNYDTVRWPTPLEDLVYGVLLALASFGRYDPAIVNGHRECLPNKTCPGTAINMNAVRVEIQRRAALGPDWPELWGTAAPYISTWGIPTAWRDQYRLGNPLGKALAGELPISGGGVMQPFERGFVVWHPTAGTKIGRWPA